MKKIFVFSLLVVAIAVVSLRSATPLNWYGPPLSPDVYGNTVLGTFWNSASSATANNVFIGPTAGNGFTSGNWNISVSAPCANGNGQINIGTPGVQTTCTIAGVVTTAGGFGSTGTNFISGTMTAWTNTNAFAVTVDFVAGVTNLCLSNSAPYQIFAGRTNSGVYARHLGPGWMFTNASAAVVISEE